MFRWLCSCLPLEVGDLGLRAELLEQLAAPRRARQTRHLALGIVEIAEHDGPRRAGVRAVPGADAAVVHLRVQPFVGVMAGVGRTDRLARRRVTLLAHHRTELDADIGELALEVPLDANPVHGAAPRRLHVADRRDVVFRVTRGHARAAAVAAIEIDRHAPSVCHYRTSPPCGCSRSSAPNRINRPSASPARAMRTRVAAQASAPVSGSETGASTPIGFSPRPLANRVYVSCPCPT